MPLSVTTICPTCGGGLDFEHGSNAVRCRYCGSSHLVTGHGRTLSYVISEKIDAAAAAALALDRVRERGGEWRVREATLFFVPFHNFRGQDLFWDMSEVVINEGDLSTDRHGRGELSAGFGFGRFLDGVGVTSDHGAEPITEKHFALSTRHIDRTFPALDAPALKVCSLGLRPDVMKMSLFEKNSLLKRGQISPVQPIEGDLEQRGYAPVLPGQIVARRVIGKSRSLIHFPFWVVETSCGTEPAGVLTVIDGVSGDVTNNSAPADLLDSLIAGDGGQFETIGLRPLKCPECAADLPTREKDVVFFCGGCSKAWYISGTEFIQVPYTVMPLNGTGDIAEYFPFWVVEARVVSGEESIGNKFELTRLAPGMRVPTEEDKNIPLRFFVPAFALGNLNILSRLSASFTRSQPVWQPAEVDRDATVARGCVISPDDVLELAPLILFSLVPKGNKKAMKFALDARVEVKEAGLVLVPFARSGMEYVDTTLGQALPAAALRD
jgi:DNA-directed RNA polymerase subunit RPC12/RpoP